MVFLSFAVTKLEKVHHDINSCFSTCYGISGACLLRLKRMLNMFGPFSFRVHGWSEVDKWGLGKIGGG